MARNTDNTLKVADAARAAAPQTPRLKARYLDEIRGRLQEQFSYTNPMLVPGLTKIVVNMGVGEAAHDSKVLDGAIKDLTAITGQKPMVVRARKSIAQFHLREGQAIGAYVTLRGDRMWEFADRLLTLALPRSQRTPLFPEIVNDPVHRRRRGLVATLLVLVLAAVIGVSSWWFAAGRFTETPAMAGMSQADAIGAAQQADLTVNVEQQYSDDVAAGVVISTDPTAGTRVERRAQIDTVVSAGPQTYAMPNVVGLPQDAASSALVGAHLAVGSVTGEYSDTVDSGRVVSAGAEAGSQVVHDTAVDLVVSMGPAPVAVTDCTGRSAADARSTLEAAGFTVTTEEKPSADVEAGKVISQDPASGQLQAGSEIHLVVSSGAEQVAVPDVRARTTADARSTLEAAGFTVEQKYVDESASTHLDRVQRTDPVRGTRLAKGSTVTIYVI